MKIIAYNEKQLNTAVKDIYQEYTKNGSIYLDYGKPYKEHTLKQLGFFFGALVDSVIRYFAELGESWSVEDVKENFYQASAYACDSLKKKCRRFNGEEYVVPKRLSEMSVEEASIFIDTCIRLIDKAHCFDGLILHPSIRYTWIRNITSDDIFNMRDVKFPRTDKEYLAHLRNQACLCCGRYLDVEVHHLKDAGKTGMAYTADDWFTIPLCRDCHLIEYHTNGREEFEEKLKWITKYIDLENFCKINYLKWRNKK